jgi:general secretion pathway protein E
MFGSRERQLTALPAAHRPATALPTDIPPQVPPVNRSPAVAAAATEVIQEFASVPNGALVTNVALTAEMRECMIAIAVAPTEAVVLVTPEWYGRAPVLDLRRQLVTHGFAKTRILRASSDVIKQRLMTHQEKATPERTGVATEPEKLVTEILKSALVRGASDVHVQTGEHGADVMFRVHGDRVAVMNLTNETAKSLAQVLHFHGQEGSKEADWNPQELCDCGISWPLNEDKTHQLSVRFSSLPRHPSSHFGFVLRFGAVSEGPIHIGQCGYTRAQEAMLEKLLSSGTGMLIFGGPTNSGKSYSLAGCAQTIYGMRGDAIKVMTVENPVENVIPGAFQVPVGGVLEYEAALKGILRHDADVVIPGEIRDRESASIVTGMTLAGRKVATTLHIFSAVSAFVRLRELGVPWDVLTMPGFINGIVCQRLVPTLCPHCKIPIREGLGRLQPGVAHALSQVTTLADHDICVAGPRDGQACEHCANTGIAGRTVVAEFLVPDRTMLQLLEKGEIASAERYWHDSRLLAIGNHGVTMLAHAIAKMEEGLVSPEDVHHHVTELTADMGFSSMLSLSALEKNPDLAAAGADPLSLYRAPLIRKTGR